MIKTIHVIKQRLDIDGAIVWFIINKFINIALRPLSIWFMIRYLSSEDQGLWYAFMNLGFLGIFAELGFTTIVTQFVSHEFANLHEADGEVRGDAKAVDRLFGLIHFSLKFYLVVVPVAIMILLGVGYFYFDRKLDPTFAAWAVFSVGCGITLLVTLLQSVYQGLDKVKQVQKNIILLTSFTIVVNSILLVFHFKIWALALGNFFGAITAMFILFKAAPAFWLQTYRYKVVGSYHFLKETLPLQWRYAISWASGFFIFYLYIPATYKYVGKIEAGQLGVTQALVAGLMNIAGSWVSSRVPKMNMLVSVKNKTELDVLFNRSVGLATAVGVVLCIMIILGLMAMNHFNIFNGRFLPIVPAALLLISYIGQSFNTYIAFYLRAHKEEPLVWVYLLNAVLIAFSIFFILRLYGLNAFLVATTLIYWVVVLPLALYVYYARKRHYARYLYSESVFPV